MIHGVEDQQMLIRLTNVEQGVAELDKKVSQIDDKMSHSIQIQGETLMETREKFSSLHSQLEDQQQLMKQWKKDIVNNNFLYSKQFWFET